MTIVYDLVRKFPESTSMTLEQDLLPGRFAHGQQIPQHLTAMLTLQHANIVLFAAGLSMQPL